MKTIKTFTTHRGNEIEVNQFDHLGEDVIVICDTSCQRERAYILGDLGELEQGEDKTKITSFEQVIYAWENEKVWF